MTRPAFPSQDCPAGPALPNKARDGGAFSCGEGEAVLAGLPGFDAGLYRAAVDHAAGTFESKNAVRLLAGAMYRAGAVVEQCPFRHADHPEQFGRWTNLVRRHLHGPAYSTPPNSKGGERRSRPGATLTAPSGDVDPRSLDGWQGDPLDLVGDQ